MEQPGDRRNRIKWSFFLVVWILVTAGIANAQSIGEVTINYIEAVNAAGQFDNEIRAYVTVSGEDQRPVAGLGRENFELLEDGQSVAVKSVFPASDPMAVVLAIDTSGSMLAKDARGQTSMESAKSAAVDFVSMLVADDQVAIFSFNKEPVLDSEFTNDKDGVIRTLRGLQAEVRAPTCLYDTAFMAVKKAAEIPMGRRAIILMTDGRDEKGAGRCSTYSVADVIDAATTKTIRVPIYTIGVGPKVDAQELGRIARLTGGRSMIAESMAELGQFYQRIADQLKRQVVVTFPSRRPSGEHSLVVKVRSGEIAGQDEKRFWSPPLPVLNPPKVAFVSPSAADSIQSGDTVPVTVRVTPADTVAKVRFYVNAVLRAERAEPPFETFQWDTTGLADGLQVLRIEALDIKGQSGYAEMTKKITASPPLASVPAPATAPVSVPVVGPKPFPMMATVAMGAVAACVIGMVVWWAASRKKSAVQQSAEPENAVQEELEDETVFMADYSQAAEVPAAYVKVVESLNLDPGATFRLTGRATVGRTDRNDINIPDKPVSRKHGEIYFEDNTYFIRDLGSQNGIKVDGKRVGGDGWPLNNGSEIRLGPKTTLTFHCRALAKRLEPDDVTKLYNDGPVDLDDDSTKLYES